MLTVDFDLLAVKDNNIALDAGCGLGRHSFEFVSRGANVFSMDMDMDCVRRTRFTLVYMRDNGQAKQGTHFQVLLGNALKLPFRDNTFDRVICAEVMEHVPDDNQACHELARVLKPGGLIAITVPTYISEMIYDILTYEYFTSPGGHIRKYVPKKLAAIMENNGLKIYAVDFRHSFHTIYWLIRCVVGLHLEDQPMTRHYRNFLTRTLFSPFMQKVERFFDNFFPKSIILYAQKPLQ
ncbi:MAG TPA: class I SAM-dependent methyltransferase [Spirochaetota bacterium]|nr:class I SAM-dependent methyltransferase [Spirochaetota bacterium]